MPTRRTARLVACLLPLVAACVRDRTEAPRRPPHITFAELEHDFGRVEATDPIEHVFHFRNVGDVDLELIDLRAPCSCDAQWTGERTVPGGAAGAIRVTCRVDQGTGPRESTVTVYSNDPEARVTTLRLRGEVVADVSAEPSELWVGGVVRGTRLDGEVIVRSAASGPRVTSIRSAGEKLETVRLPPPDGDDEVRFTVAVAENAPLGPLSEQILVHTTSARRPVLRVLVSGRVEPDVVVSPPEIDFGEIAGDDGRIRHLLIRNQRPERPLQITAAEIAPDLGSAVVELIAPDTRYHVRVELGDAVRGELSGTLRLRTNLPELPLLDVPIRGRVSASPGDAGAR